MPARLPISWLVSFALVAGCGSNDETVAPSIAPEPEERVAPSDPPEPPPPPAASPAWQDMPVDFAPVVLPRVQDSCDGPVLWVGPASIERRPAPERVFDRGEGLPGIAAEVQRLFSHGSGDYAPLGDMSGAYNGPGGEPRFRWHLGMSTGLPVVVFDQRVSRHRMIQVLRGANHEGLRPVRIGGVDEDGGRRCAIFLPYTEDDLQAQPENFERAAVTQPDGTLTVGGDHLDVPGRPLSGETEDGGLHLLTVSVGDPVPTLRALAFARWGERRYAHMEVAAAAYVPGCLPAATACGCLEGCARGVSLPLQGGVEVRYGAEAVNAPVERWCIDASGHAGPAAVPEVGECFDVFVISQRCGGGCVGRAAPNCAACEACDASCAGEPISRP